VSRDTKLSHEATDTLNSAFRNYFVEFKKNNELALESAKASRWETLCSKGVFKTMPHLSADDHTFLGEKGGADALSPIAVSVAVDHEAGSISSSLRSHELAYLTAWKSKFKTRVKKCIDLEMTRRWETVAAGEGPVMKALESAIQAYENSHILCGSLMRTTEKVLTDILAEQIDPLKLSVDVDMSIVPTVDLIFIPKSAAGDMKQVSVPVLTLPLSMENRLYFDAYKAHPSWKQRATALKIERFHQHAKNYNASFKHTRDANNETLGDKQWLLNAIHYILDIDEGLENPDPIIIEYRKTWEISCKALKDQCTDAASYYLMNSEQLESARSAVQVSRDISRSKKFVSMISTRTLHQQHAKNQGGPSERDVATYSLQDEMSIQNSALNAWKRMTTSVLNSINKAAALVPASTTGIVAAVRLSPRMSFEEISNKEMELPNGCDFNDILAAVALKIKAKYFYSKIPSASPSHPFRQVMEPRLYKEQLLCAKAWAEAHPDLIERAKMIKMWTMEHESNDDMPSLPSQEDLLIWYERKAFKWHCSCKRTFKTAGELFKHKGMDKCGGAYKMWID